MKILLAQAHPRVGNLNYNFNLISNYYQQAISCKADICLIPELITIGYPAEDLILFPEFLKDLEHLSAKLVTEIKNTALLLPTIISENQKIFNGVIAIQNGKIIGKSTKKHLPNYGVFDEKRYFSEGFPQIIEINGVKIGVPICEDIWYADICSDLTSKGAQLLLVPNASPYEINKFDQRLELVKQRFQENKIPIIYCNQVLAQDGLIFDGRSFAYDGNLRFVLDIFREDTLEFHFDNGKVIVNKPTQNKNSVEIALQQSVKMEDEIYGAMVFGLRDYVLNNGFNSVLLGLSGGIDSALTAMIAADSFGSENVLAVMMPSKFTSKESLIDAELIIKNIGINYQIIPIDDMLSAAENSLTNLPTLAHQNLQARLRGVILMSLSNSNNQLLITTGNKSEYATGYATIYGDMCGAFNPIKDIYKTEIYKIARFRNNNTPLSINIKTNITNAIPERVFTKAPTAELSFNQKDSDSLPEYRLLDKVLKLHIEQKLSHNEIVRLGFDDSVVKKVISLVRGSEFKRRQSAPGVKISSCNFEKDRRYPITT